MTADESFIFPCLNVLLDSYRVVDEESSRIPDYIRRDSTLSAIGWRGFLPR